MKNSKGSTHHIHLKIGMYHEKGLFLKSRVGIFEILNFPPKMQAGVVEFGNFFPKFQIFGKETLKCTPIIYTIILISNSFISNSTEIFKKATKYSSLRVVKQHFSDFTHILGKINEEFPETVKLVKK